MKEFVFIDSIPCKCDHSLLLNLSITIALEISGKLDLWAPISIHMQTHMFQTYSNAGKVSIKGIYHICLVLSFKT